LSHCGKRVWCHLLHDDLKKEFFNIGVLSFRFRTSFKVKSFLIGQNILNMVYGDIRMKGQAQKSSKQQIIYPITMWCDTESIILTTKR
jgi:hypothetical protein